MGNYSEEKIDSIWKKAKVQDGEEKNIWRKDYAGAWINRKQYGMETDFGWEIDHMKPVSKGGSDDLSNLVPLQWENNRTKGDDYPGYKTSITSDDNKNIKKVQSWKY